MYHCVVCLNTTIRRSQIWKKIIGLPCFQSNLGRRSCKHSLRFSEVGNNCVLANGLPNKSFLTNSLNPIVGSLTGTSSKVFILRTLDVVCTLYFIFTGLTTMHVRTESKCASLIIPKTHCCFPISLPCLICIIICSIETVQFLKC